MRDLPYDLAVSQVDGRDPAPGRANDRVSVLVDVAFVSAEVVTIARLLGRVRQRRAPRYFIVIHIEPLGFGIETGAAPKSPAVVARQDDRFLLARRSEHRPETKILQL